MFFDDLEIQSLNLSDFTTFLTLFLILYFFLSEVLNFIIFSFLLSLKYIDLVPLFLFLCTAREV